MTDMKKYERKAKMSLAWLDFKVEAKEAAVGLAHVLAGLAIFGVIFFTFAVPIFYMVGLVAHQLAAWILAFIGGILPVVGVSHFHDKWNALSDYKVEQEAERLKLRDDNDVMLKARKGGLSAPEEDSSGRLTGV